MRRNHCYSVYPCCSVKKKKSCSSVICVMFCCFGSDSATKIFNEIWLELVPEVKESAGEYSLLAYRA